MPSHLRRFLSTGQFLARLILRLSSASITSPSVVGEVLLLDPTSAVPAHDHLACC